MYKISFATIDRIQIKITVPPYIYTDCENKNLINMHANACTKEAGSNLQGDNVVNGKYMHVQGSLSQILNLEYPLIFGY